MTSLTELTAPPLYQSPQVLIPMQSSFLTFRQWYVPFKMLRAHSHKLRTRFSLLSSMMALAKAGSSLARIQRHNAFLFSRADMSNDGCDYDMFLFISWECKRTGTFPSQVGYYCTGTSVLVWTVSSRRLGNREVCKQKANMDETDLP